MEENLHADESVCLRKGEETYDYKNGGDRGRRTSLDGQPDQTLHHHVALLERAQALPRTVELW